MGDGWPESRRDDREGGEARDPGAPALGLAAWRTAGGEGAGVGEDAPDLPPLEDPYLAGGPVNPARGVAAAPIPRAGASRLAEISVVALIGGPVGAVAAIVFGWAARREIDEAPGRRIGHGLATLVLVLGVLLTVGWGAGLAMLAWAWTYNRGALAAAPAPEPSASDASPAPPAPAAATPPPGGSVPQRTRQQQIGALTVVDVGIDVRTLGEELAKQRAEAYEIGERLLVMTTRDQCSPCRGVDLSLSDPLMQTALRGVRLIRVDIDVFQEDLDELKIPHQAFPGFFLLSLDLTPQDGINGGEWDEDIPRNIAPVLGAFVRGQHRARREAWKPLPRSGMRL